jgi:hypothetical protein
LPNSRERFENFVKDFDRISTRRSKNKLKKV